MQIQLSYDDFCKKYFKKAMEFASNTIGKTIKKYGQLDPHIDVESVKSTGVIYALDKVFRTYDVDHGEVEDYLYIVVRNAVISALAKETTAVNRFRPTARKKKQADPDIQDAQTPEEKKKIARRKKDAPLDGRFIPVAGTAGDDGQKFEPHDYWKPYGYLEQKDKAICRLEAAIRKLIPTEQKVINLYLADKKTYVQEFLKLYPTKSANAVYQILNSAKANLAKLMGGKRPDYRDIYMPSSRARTIYDVPFENVRGSNDYNFQRRRQRAADAHLTGGMDYGAMAEKLYDEMVK